jgi:HNH endonuclease
MPRRRSYRSPYTAMAGFLSGLAGVLSFPHRMRRTLDKITLEQMKIEQKKRNLENISFSRKPIPDDVQIFVWNRDGGKCAKCGGQENLEFDHIVPLSKNGSNTARNIQLLCEYCNRKKRNSIGG